MEDSSENSQDESQPAVSGKARHMMITAKEARDLVRFKVIFEKSVEEQLELLSAHVTQEISSAALRGVYTIRSSIPLACYAEGKVECVSRNRLWDLLRENGFTLTEEAPYMAISWHPSKYPY